MNKLLIFFHGSQTELAKALGCSQSYVSMVISGQRRFSYKLALKAEEITNGVIKKTDLRPDIWEKL